MKHLVSSKVYWLLAGIAIASIATTSSAEDIFVAQSAVGAGTGVDAADAYPITFFNTASNWSSPTKVNGKIGPGDIVHLVGSISQIAPQADGVSGNPITVFWEPGAKLSSPNTLLCYMQNRNYFIFDGGTNGVVENTANGTGLANQTTTSGFYASGMSNVTYQNLTIQNLYVHTSPADAITDPTTGGGIYANGYGPNCVVRNCSFNNMGWCITAFGNPGGTLTVTGCSFQNYDHGIGGVATQNAGAVGVFTATNNHFGSTAVWDTTANSYHHDGIHTFWGPGSLGMSNAVITGNLFDGNWGVNNTAHIFLEQNYNTHASSEARGWLIANNVHIQFPGNILNNGFMVQIGDNAMVANNTYLGTSVPLSLGVSLNGANVTFENNIISGLNRFLSSSNPFAAGGLNHNLYAAAVPSGNTPFSYIGANVPTFAAWQTATAQDSASSQVISAALNVNGSPQVSSPAIDAGTDLSALFTNDQAGLPRPSGIAWDIGAFEFIQTNPVIVTQPLTQFVAIGGTVTLSVLARGQATLVYQWSKGGTPLSNGGVVSGALTNTLVLTGVSTLNTGSYTCTVNNTLGPPVTSNPAVITVATPPIFSLQPAASTSVATGGSTSLTVAATATPSAAYQWQLGGINLTDGGVYAGVTAATITLTGLTGVNGGIYTAIATNAGGSVSSTNALLTVTGTSAPVIQVQPAPSQTVLAGATASFSVVVAGTPAPSLQWQKNGVNLSNGGVISGANGSTLTLTGLGAGDAGNYTVVATNGVGSPATSGVAALLVTLLGTAPSFSIQPISSNALPGATVNFTVAASGSPTPTFQWQKNGVNISDGGTVSGANTATLTLTGISLQDTGTYDVVATNSIGTAISGSALLGSIAIVPTVQTVNSGSTVTLTASTGNAQITSIQWYLDGNPIPSNGIVLTIPNVSKSANQGTYTAVVTDGAGSFMAANVTVNVTIPSRLVNISVRAVAGPLSQTLIAGFVVSGGSKSILLRGVGPSLIPFGLVGALADPDLSLFNSAGTLIQSNDNWGGTSTLKTAFELTGAFPFADNSLDSALLVNVPSGPYTSLVTGAGGGIALAEIYDTDTAEAPAGRLINISARAEVGAGNNVLIAGFVVSGDTPVRVLIRGVGPALTPLGVSGALVDPQIELYSGSTIVAQNDNWGGTASLNAAFAEAGAFPLPDPNSKDAALVATLQPGEYTVLLSGTNGGTGVGLVEIYLLP